MKLLELGERRIIDQLARLCGSGKDVCRGIGDDAAVVRAGEYDFVLTSDPVIEGVHFETETQAERIGHKAVGRVLSDLAAMGAEPLWMLMDVVAPPAMEQSFLSDVYTGACDLLKMFDTTIIGGDVAQGTPFQLHVFGVGRVPHGTAVLRSGAEEGDCLFITGTLGGSIKGKHLDFMPRVKEGCWLREQGWATAMIDISDGLVSELFHLAGQSGVDIELDTESVPISEAACEMNDERSPLEHALYDGEDFELLFAVSAADATAFLDAWQRNFDLPCCCIGKTVPGKGIVKNLSGHILSAEQCGFEHFSS